MYRSQEQMGVGFEGAGEIIEVASNVSKEMIGRKVAFSQDPHSPTFTGTWRQQVVAKLKSCIVYPDSADYDTICSSYVNPLTACGFVDMCVKAGVGAVI